MDLMAAGGATIVVNTSSNFIVSSGVAPVGEMLRRGCRVAMGLDGLSFDEERGRVARDAACLCCP
jgi:cytosine/adenosine deaminase-related metal-dependent hydrolase